MFPEERRNRIVAYLEKNSTATVQELVDALDASAATVRRDLLVLHDENRIAKVFGGATSLDYRGINAAEPSVAEKATRNMKEKDLIAAYAASLIEDDDFVYIDSGTTTLALVDHITNVRASYVTNGIVHAKRMIERGLSTTIIGGRVKPVTEALIGPLAVEALSKLHFTKSFMGTNGITEKTGFTTPDSDEAMVKSEAVRHSRQAYVLADHSKFGAISPVTFAGIWDCCIITDAEPDKRYRELTEVRTAK